MGGLRNDMVPYTVIDIETVDMETGFKRTAERGKPDIKTAKLVGLGWYSSDADRGWITDEQSIKQFFALRTTDQFAAHNGKYDLSVLGLRLGVWPRLRFDTYLAGTLLPPQDKPA